MSVYVTGQAIKKIDNLIQHVENAAHWIDISNPDGTVKWSRPKLTRIERQLAVLKDLEEAVPKVLRWCTIAQAEWLGDLHERISELQLAFFRMQQEEHNLLNQKEND